MGARRKSKTLLPILAAGLMVLTLSSCTTTTHYVETPQSAITVPIVKPVVTVPPSMRRGIYHSVSPGETLWRISRMYNVDAEIIKKANRITNVRDIEIGRRLYIPDAASRRHVITLYPSSRWKYIIIHHSATDFGSSSAFNNAHIKKGWKGVGYDFIIDNGTCGKDDGQIETTQRWIKQLDGAHCKAGGMNKKGIGICVVGNLSDDMISPRQMASLSYLVRTLKGYYNIPDRNIMGHGQVPGAQTECPGKRFPWSVFRSSMGD